MCRTHWGRLVTIIYSLIGIPLTLLVIANTGNSLAKFFKIAYLYTSEKLDARNGYLYGYRFSKGSKISQSQFQDYEEENGLVDNNTKPQNQSVSRKESINDRNNKREKSSRKKQDEEDPYSVLASSMLKTAIICKEIGESATDKPKFLCKNTSALATIEKETMKRRRKQEIRIPVYMPLAIFMLYMILGAFMFSIWEDWHFLDGILFSFLFEFK